MGTVGINFGSATSGAGFDVTSTVTSILALSSSIENPWTAHLATLKTQDAALTSIGTDLATLSTAVSALTNFDGVLASKEGASSDTNVLSLSAASPAAVAGSHTVYVTSLASTSSQYTGLIAKTTDILSGSLTIQVGTSASTAGVAATAAQTITIGATNNTLASLATSINDGSYGVTASVVTDSTGSRLSLVSSTSGAAGQIKLGGGLNDASAGLVANASDTLTGSLTIQVGTPGATTGVAATAAQTITVGPTNNTLASMAAYINSGSYGVTASVLTDGTGSQLSLVSQMSGGSNQVLIGGTLADAATSTSAVPASVGFTQGQQGADAVLTVDGLPTTSASNTVTGAIPGVTFQLLSEAPTEPVQIQITNNNTSVETAVQAFVTAYNTVAGDIKTQAGNDANGNPEPLYGDPTMSLIQSQLAASLFGGEKSGAISSIQQLGISTNADGTLTLDASTLDAALNSNYSDITGFFQNAGSFGQGLSTTLNTLGSASPSGAISLELAQDSTTSTGLNTDITNENLLLATEKTNLTLELNTANQELQAIPEQLTEVNEIYSAVTGYNQSTNG